MTHLVFWHGWGMRTGVWQKLADLLKRQDMISLPSLPGYDDTAFPVPYTAEAVVDALMENHTAPRTAPVTLCGWSLGAMLALLAAHRHPDKVQKLILFSATPSFVQRENWPHAVTPTLLSEFTQAIEVNVETALKRFVAMFNHNDINAKSNVKDMSDFNIPALEVLTGGLHILRDLDLRDIVSGITQPTLVIHGAHDPLMPLAAAEWMKSTLPHATLKICPQAAHAPFISAPEQCADWITEWLTA
ncbi:MAG: alpha/beta fold hydrolase [Oxalobacter sp.]|nr:MAG: alpha/beta fold hydrolase [Oxalobacter sp.]